jgi:hypothetical protein
MPLCSSPSHAQLINTLHLDFERLVTKDASTDTLVGEIYYSGTQTYVKIVDPIDQIMVFSDNRLLVYYPNEKSAVIMNNYKAGTISFTQAFINVTKEDFGLSEIGFVFEETILDGDTLTMKWKPSEELKKLYGPIELNMVNNQLATIVAWDKKGHITATTAYSDHVAHKGHFFPLRIRTTRYEEKTIYEEVKFSNPVFGDPVPIGIKDFALPKDTNITELEL